MRFVKFKIEKFKGVEEAVIDLEPAGSNVFTLIGLNESGKTTILEALNSFNLNVEKVDALSKGKHQEVNPEKYVPMDLKSAFTDDITVSAWLKFEDGEKEKIAELFKEKNGAIINIESINDPIQITRGYNFKNSEFQERIRTTGLSFFAKTKRGKNEKQVFSADDPLWKDMALIIRDFIPQIIYFETFQFDQPDEIILNCGEEYGESPEANTETDINKLYREIIENIAKFVEKPKLNVKEHIVDRMLGGETAADFVGNVARSVMGLDDTEKRIESVVNQMSEHLTRTIFKNWQKIFGVEFSRMKIKIAVYKRVDENSVTRVCAKFLVEDGSITYDIDERSLGFRWFFSFLLFTFYKVVNNKKPVLFLFDEPASNLHAQAQNKLLNSFPVIIDLEGRSNQIMYSTHSHYLINPEWLEQAFIVSNAAIDYENKENEFATSRGTNIGITKYKNFVGQNPDKITYFQPVLDRLQVAPSKLDIARPSVLVEGKGDFFVIEYGRKVLLKKTNSFSVVPTRGADGMDELIGLFLGWGIDFVICLDDDAAGRKAKKRYITEGLPEEQVWTLSDISDELKGKRIEGLLEKTDIDIIKNHFNIKTNPSKKQILSFFSEMLACEKEKPLSKEFRKHIRVFEGEVKKALSGSNSGGEDKR